MLKKRTTGWLNLKVDIIRKALFYFRYDTNDIFFLVMVQNLAQIMLGQDNINIEIIKYVNSHSNSEIYYDMFHFKSNAVALNDLIIEIDLG